MKKLTIIFTFILIDVFVFGGDKSGTVGFKFLRITPGAKGISLGKIATALNGDINTVFYNPAGIVNLKEKEFSVSHTKWLSDINQQTLCGVLPTKYGNFTLGISYLHMGEFTGYDIGPTGEPFRISNFVSYDTLGIMSYSRKILGQNLGINFKIFQEKIEEAKAKGFAFDIGLQKKIKKKTILGLAIQNLGNKVEFVREKTSLPFNIKAGVSTKLFKETLSIFLDVEKPKDDDLTESLALEVNFKTLLLRAGYNTGFNSGFLFGIGFLFNAWIIDYAYAPFGKLGDTHQFTFSTRFSIFHETKRLEREREKLEIEKRKLENEKIEIEKEKKIILSEKRELENLRKKLAEEKKKLALKEKIENAEEKEVELVAIVTQINGTLETKSYNKKEWNKATTGTFVFEGDSLRTLKDSTAILTFVYGTEIKINENTQFSIPISQKMRKLKHLIDLKIGEIFSNVEKKKEIFHIKTEAAIATVRGTEFNVRYTTNRCMAVEVLKGVVEVGNNLGKVMVPDFMKTMVYSGKPPIKPIKIRPDKQEFWFKNLKVEKEFEKNIQNTIREIKKLKIESIIKNLEKERGIVVEKSKKIEKKEVEKKAVKKESKESIETKKEILKITATSEVVHFAFDSADFPAADYRVLSQIAKILRQLSDFKVKIEGHTDNIGDEEYNKKLSLKRAETIKRYFVEIENFPSDKFIVKGFGEENPVAPNNTLEGRVKNRRVEIIIEY